MQVTTFTDCVNCLIAFTNNPHSLDVSLNAIAFLRFCAMKLAEGAIGARCSLIRLFKPGIALMFHVRVQPTGCAFRIQCKPCNFRTWCRVIAVALVH